MPFTFPKPVLKVTSAKKNSWHSCWQSATELTSCKKVEKRNEQRLRYLSINLHNNTLAHGEELDENAGYGFKVKSGEVRGLEGSQ